MNVSSIMSEVFYKPILPASITVRKHWEFLPYSILYHLDEVNCDGTEANLTECEHNEIGIADCSVSSEQPGVICYSKFQWLII